MASLAPTFGRGAMTNSWVDIKNANLILIMGGNAAEAHPCGFKWVTEAKAHNKARLIVVDPRFNRSAAVADVYAPIRSGSDIAFLGGLINYLLTNDKIQHDYVKAYTDASFIVRADYDFKDGLFSGYDPKTRKYDRSTWMYELGHDGYVKVDPTFKHERCVLNLREAALLPLYPRRGERNHRHTQGGLPQDLRHDRRDSRTRQNLDHALCARVDSAQSRHADDSLCRHGPAAARQCGHGRRRHERAQRAFQHPRPHRSRAADQFAAWLSDTAERARSRLQELHRDAHAQATASEPAQLLVELPEVPRELDESLVRTDGDQGQQLVLRLAAEARQAARRAAGVRGHVPGTGERLRVPGLQCGGGVPEQAEAGRRIVEAQVPGCHRSTCHRDVRVLAQLRCAQRRRFCEDPDRSVPPAVDLLRRRGRLAREQREVAAMALEGCRSARRGQGRYRDHGHAVHAAAGALQKRRRRVSGSDPRSDLEPSDSRRPVARGARQGIQRQGAGRCRGCEDEERAWSRPEISSTASHNFRTTARRPADAGSSAVRGPAKAT